MMPGNNPDSYRKETQLTFLTETSGAFEYREYVSGGLDFFTSGEFDFSWLAGTSGSERWVPVGLVYVSWPFIYADGWHFLDTSAASIQWRVNLENELGKP